MSHGWLMAVVSLAAPAVAGAAEPFYLPADPTYSIVDSSRDSVRFALHCLVPEGDGLRAKSTFVDPQGQPALWHEFGAVEGVGWAANAVGGAIELIEHARFFAEPAVEEPARKLLHHAVHGGFVDAQTGFLRPYRDLSNGRYFLNYLHAERHDRWFCAGSAAKVALQYLWAADLCAGTPLGEESRACGMRLARWLRDHVEPAPNGWFPRRSYPDGKPYPFTATGDDRDPFFDGSGDGLYLLWLYAEMARRGEEGFRPRLERPLKAFLDAGGFFGSMNHDTYDRHENVCYAVAFRVLTRLADGGFSSDPEGLRRFAFEKCLKGLERFEMTDDRNGVATRGLLWMEASWDTAYLWENAEAALAWLEAARATGRRDWLNKGATILRAAAKHHYGPHGFLTEGVDWNNHNGQFAKVGDKEIPIHVGSGVFGAVNYTQPLLNNLHIVEPTLYYLRHFALRATREGRSVILDHEDNVIWRQPPATGLAP